jgi:hypothetical protein
LELEVGQAAIEEQFRFASSAGLPERRYPERTVRRDADDAAIIELQLSFAVLFGSDFGSLEQGSICQCRVSDNLVAVGQYYVTLDEAQAGGAHVWIRLLRTDTNGCRHE